MNKRLGDNPLAKKGEEKNPGMNIAYQLVYNIRWNKEAQNVYNYLKSHGPCTKYKIARAQKLDVTTVIKALKDLQKAGMIHVHTGSYSTHAR